MVATSDWNVFKTLNASPYKNMIIHVLEGKKKEEIYPKKQNKSLKFETNRIQFMSIV